MNPDVEWLAGELEWALEYVPREYTPDRDRVLRIRERLRRLRRDPNLFDDSIVDAIEDVNTEMV